MSLTARHSVSLLFLINGFLIGTWAAKIPAFADRLSLSESAVGLMIVVFGVGAILTMPVIGVTIARLGTARVTRYLSLTAATTMLWITLSPNVAVAAMALFVFGGLISGMDVAMNTFAVEVEKKIARPIMSSCHGFWSLGGLGGAVVSGYLLEFSDIYVHALVTTVASLIIVVLALPQLRATGSSAPAEKTKLAFPRMLLPYLVGFVALCSAMPEGAVIDWSALYLRNELGASTLAASFAFGAFSGTMAIVRFFGDPIRSRYGAVSTMRFCALTAAVGLFIAGTASTGELAIVGFLIAGLGMSNLVPIAFSAAGNLPGLAPGIGLSMATTIGYSGLLVAPASFGYVAEIFSFSLVFTGLALALLLVMFLAPIAKHADAVSVDTG
ncbi:MAG: MFS transporter [Rhizobiaceae bacterium]